MPLPQEPFSPLTEAERAASLAAALAAAPAGSVFPIFGYGALLWWDAVARLTRTPAALEGYKRSMCIWSVEARGTVARPGLGLGLVAAAGARCSGVLLEVPLNGAATADGTGRELLARIWEREMWTGVYRPIWIQVRTEGGARPAVAFEAVEAHPQFASDLTTEDQAMLISRASGRFGSCADYLRQTAAGLAAQGTPDSELEALLHRVDAHSAESRCP